MGDYSNGGSEEHDPESVGAMSAEHAQDEEISSKEMRQVAKRRWRMAGTVSVVVILAVVLGVSLSASSKNDNEPISSAALEQPPTILSPAETADSSSIPSPTPGSPTLILVPIPSSDDAAEDERDATTLPTSNTTADVTDYKAGFLSDLRIVQLSPFRGESSWNASRDILDWQMVTQDQLANVLNNSTSNFDAFQVETRVIEHYVVSLFDGMSSDGQVTEDEEPRSLVIAFVVYLEPLLIEGSQSVNAPLWNGTFDEVWTEWLSDSLETITTDLSFKAAYLDALQATSSAFEGIVMVEVLQSLGGDGANGLMSILPSESPASSPTMQPTRAPITTEATQRPTVRNSLSPTATATELTQQPTVQPSLSPTSTLTVTSLPMVTRLGTYELLETVAHDPDAFTQGLELVPEGMLLNPESPKYFESTGLYGRSSVRQVDLATGQVLQQHNLDSSYFGEGLTYWDGKLIQITWKAQTAFVYNATTLDVLEERSFTTTNTQGWGICHAPNTTTDDNGQGGVFYVSDGTEFLHMWDVLTLGQLGKVAVTRRSSSSTTTTTTIVNRINELEWDFHSQSVLANIWYTDDVIRIDPTTGFITNQYDLSSLPRPAAGADVLNGIAVTNVANEIWVTGKLWPNLYRIRLIDE